MSAPLLFSLLANALLLGLLFCRSDFLARLRGRQTRDETPPSQLARLAGELDGFATHYFLWLISARIAMWTAEPEELRHAEEMMEAGRSGLARATETLGAWRAEAPRAAQALIDELLRAGAVNGITPTAEVFNRKAEEVRLLVDRAKRALRA
jgi:hypothetical protein